MAPKSKSVSRKEGARPELAASAGLFSKFQIFYPVLGSCILERNPFPEHDPNQPSEDPKEKDGRFYDSVIRLMNRSPDDPVDVAVCEFSAGKKVRDTKVIEIQATYFVGFSLGASQVSDEDRKHFVEELVSSTAWPLYRDLFIHVGSQSGDELPLLPNSPKLRWITSHQPSEAKAD